MSVLAPSRASSESQAAESWTDFVLRPERFFPERALRLRRPVVTAMVVLLGTAAAVDRMDGASFAALLGRVEVDPVRDWSTYWAAVAMVAVFAGPLAYYGGGFWYWLRLSWSGAEAADFLLARRIHLVSSSLVAAVGVAVTALASIQFPDPGSVQPSVDALASLLVVPFASVFVSYRAATASHRLRRRAALLWFAVLPSVFFAALFLWGVLAGMGQLG